MTTSDDKKRAASACKKAHAAWRESRAQFPELTMDLAQKLRDLRLAHVSKKDGEEDTKVSNAQFSAALKAADLGDKVINPHDRAALLEMANPKYKKCALKVLKETDRWSPQHIWAKELKPALIEAGLIEQKERPSSTTDSGEHLDDNDALDVSDQYDPCVDPISAAYSLGHLWVTEENFAAFLASLTDEVRAMLAGVDADQALRAIADALSAEKIEKAA